MSKQLARKVAFRYIQSAAEWSHLAPILLKGATQAQMAVECLEALTARAQSLIDASEHKEHIYREAGDIISGIRGEMSKIREGVAVITYAAGKVNEKKLKGSFPAALKDNIDRAIKKGDI